MTVRAFYFERFAVVAFLVGLLFLAGLAHRKTSAGFATPGSSTLSFISVPTVMPEATALGTYSPLVQIQYAGLDAEIYTIQVAFLQTDSLPYNCATTTSSMWCGQPIVIDNMSGTNSSGMFTAAPDIDVFDYQHFLWVADLYNHSGVKVTTVTAPALPTAKRPPALNPIGDKTTSVGQSINFTISASDPQGDSLNFTAQNVPAGATFNDISGEFQWQPSVAGTYSVPFIASEVSDTSLSDAEVVTIRVGTTPPAGVLAFDRSSYTTGEVGPAVLTVIRSDGSAGTVWVSYQTSNGTAASGQDYTAASGNVSFADGETSKTIGISTIPNDTIGANGTFFVSLSAPTNGATLGTPSSVPVTIVDDDSPQLSGEWGGVISLPTVPIHMVLLPTGNVMFWDRHKDDEVPMWDGNPRLWDLAAPTVFTTLALPGWDLFCSGHVLLADGRLLVTGGHIADGVGTLKAGIYNSVTDMWKALPDMNAGRWYPSNTTLANGDVLVLAGTSNGYADMNPLPQVWQVGLNSWRNLSNALLGTNPAWADFYPFTYQAPNGKVFVAGPQQTARYLDTSGTGAWTDVANSSLAYRDYGSSVMYDDGKVLIVGGNPRDASAWPIILPSASAEVIDLNAASPAWRAVAPMSVGRRHLNTTLLPDGKILVTGGSSAPGFDEPGGAVLFAELWDPSTETWAPMAAHARYRGYHSNAMLLPDGRVLIAGGGHPDPPGGAAQDNAEIYSPPYLFKGTRPLITAAPTSVAYGQKFSIQTPDAASIATVNWIRLPAVTHAFNQNQRINHLRFAKRSNALDITAPANGNLCPPGHYMLFILNSDGVPSIAQIIQINPEEKRRGQLISP